jgi:hypothetical protein
MIDTLRLLREEREMSQIEDGRAGEGITLLAVKSGHGVDAGLLDHVRGADPSRRYE